MEIDPMAATGFGLAKRGMVIRQHGRVARQLLARGVDKEALLSSRTAGSMMTRNPVTCSVDDSLNVAAQRMWEHDVGALPVVDGTGQLVGMITDRDVAMAAYTQGMPLAQIVVKRAMSADLWCVQPHSPISEVEMLMQRHQVRRIPVVDGGRHPIGMVSLNDLARRTSVSEGAKVSREELTQTLAAVCEPRPSMRA